MTKVPGNGRKFSHGMELLRSDMEPGARSIGNVEDLGHCPGFGIRRIILLL